MTERELKQILKQEEEIPDVVENCIERTLQNLQVQEEILEKKKGKRKKINGRRYLGIAGLAAVICVIVTASAYAAVQYFDILNYVFEKNINISGFWNKRNIDDAERIEQLADSNLIGTKMENEYAVYTVSEIRNDGELILALFEVMPKGEYLIIPQDFMEEDYIQWMLPEELPDEMKEVTVGEYAEASKKELLYIGVSIWGNERVNGNSVDYFMSEDGSGYFNITVPVTGGFDSEISLQAVGTARRGEDELAKHCETELTVVRENTETKTVYFPELNDELHELGVELQKAEIKETVLGLYVTFYYILDYNKWTNEMDRGMTMELATDQGIRLRNMPHYSGSGRVETENGFMQINAYQKNGEIKEYSVIVRNYETGEVYGTVKLTREK